MAAAEDSDDFELFGDDDDAEEASILVTISNLSCIYSCIYTLEAQYYDYPLGGLDNKLSRQAALAALNANLNW